MYDHSTKKHATQEPYKLLVSSKSTLYYPSLVDQLVVIEIVDVHLAYMIINISIYVHDVLD